MKAAATVTATVLTMGGRLPALQAAARNSPAHSMKISDVIEALRGKYAQTKVADNSAAAQKAT